MCEHLTTVEGLAHLSIDDVEKANNAIDAYQDAQHRASRIK